MNDRFGMRLQSAAATRVGYDRLQDALNKYFRLGMSLSPAFQGRDRLVTGSRRVATIEFTLVQASLCDANTSCTFTRR